MKTNYFVVKFDFTEGAESAIFAAVENSAEDAAEFINLVSNATEKNVRYKSVPCDENKFRLVSMTEDGEFTDFGETYAEKDACNALREEVETSYLFPYDQITMEDDGRGDVVDDDEPIDLYDEETEHIFYGLYADKDDKRIIYFVVGE